MYGLFARDDWMVQPRSPQPLDFASCEGIAQASLVSVYCDTAVIMASPLYVRVLSLPEDETSGESRRERRDADLAAVARLQPPGSATPWRW
jgi:hypothetical protein